MDTPEIYVRLRELAPSVHFSVRRHLDPTFEWDGDGPDPQEDGFDPYDVCVEAKTIVSGQVRGEEVWLGGCYFKPTEDIGEIHGYLLQMLEESAAELRKQLLASVTMVGLSMPPLPVNVRDQINRTSSELRDVTLFLRSEMTARWEAQQAAK